MNVCRNVEQNFVRSMVRELGSVREWIDDSTDRLKRLAYLAALELKGRDKVTEMPCYCQDRSHRVRNHKLKSKCQLHSAIIRLDNNIITENIQLRQHTMSSTA